MGPRSFSRKGDGWRPSILRDSLAYSMPRSEARDSEKEDYVRRVLRVSQVAILVAFAGSASAEAAPPNPATATGHEPTEVAAAYLEAMESGDMEAAGALFTPKSSVFESGGQEGDWHHYHEHHLGPELSAIKSFTVSRGEPEVEESQDGSMALVAWPIKYRIVLEEQRVIESNGTVTFVLVRGDDGLRIRHLHWSSRKQKPADG
jgi:SnoaL-like domain